MINKLHLAMIDYIEGMQREFNIFAKCTGYAKLMTKEK